MTRLTLLDYWRSSASYRVRIALHIKGLAYDAIAVNILPGRDEQLTADFIARNPQAKVPVLATDVGDLSQSLAIVEYLNEIAPDPPLLPADPWTRAQVRAFALAIACDIHPLNNLAVQRRIREQWGDDPAAITAWGRHWVETGLQALEARLADQPPSDFAFGATPGLAEVCLVPQMYNARRLGVVTEAFANLHRIDQAARALPAFQSAAPERQADAPKDL